MAQENMDVFKEAWEKEVRLLTEAVDDITTIHDFLAVSGRASVKLASAVVYLKIDLQLVLYDLELCYDT